MKKFSISFFILIMSISLISQSVVELGSLEIIPGPEPGPYLSFGKIQYTNNKLVTTTNSGILILDVSDPTNLEFSSSINIVGGGVSAIKLNDDKAYLGGYGSFIIADISNIDDPFIAGGLDVLGSKFDHITVNDSVAFSTGFGKCYSILVSDPTNPTVIDIIGFDFGTLPWGTAIVGNYLYVATTSGLTTNSIKIFDITDPYNLELISSFEGDYREIITDHANNRIFCSKPGIGFDALDINDPLNPEVLYSGVRGELGCELITHYDNLICQEGVRSLNIYLISDDSSILIENYSLEGIVRSITNNDSIFYVSTGSSLHILSVSATSNAQTGNHIEPELYIYPVPSSSNITIESEKQITGIVKLTVHNSTGQLVESININMFFGRIIHDISKYASGVYQLSIYSGNEFLGASAVFKE